MNLIKRFVTIIPPRYGSLLFTIHRYVFEDSYLNIIISPDDELIISDMTLSLTSTTFYNNSHFVVGLSTDKDILVIHDDLKEESFVSFV